MLHAESDIQENTFRSPDIIRAGNFVLLSLLLLFFYFLGTHIMGAYGLIIFFLVTAIAAFLGVEFFVVYLLVALFLQNILIASMTTTDDPNDLFQFRMCLATSFLLTCLFSVYGSISWLGLRKNLPSENTVLLRWIIFFSLVAIAYCAPGLAASDMKSMLAYLRVYLGAAMFLCIGVAAGYRVSVNFLISTIRILAAILVIWGISELLFGKELLGFFNVLHFIRMKTDGTKDVLENLDVIVQPQTYLNLSGQFGLELKLPRLVGPNIHSISYAYELAFCGLLCFMYGYRILAFACFLVLTVVGAKGAMVEALVSVFFYVFYCISRRPRLMLFLVTVFISMYVASVVYYGLISRDFHILGLTGSIHGFLTNPLGRGVGVGGNLSTLALQNASMEDFQRFQLKGTADFALESGFGVMLYQLGVGTIVFLIFYYYLFKYIWDNVLEDNTDKRMIILPLALLFMLVNSLFQEEAFSPAGIGLWLFFSGFFLANQWHKKSQDMGSPV